MPDTPDQLERLARGISAALTIRLISGDTDQKYTPNEVAVMVESIINEQLSRLRAEEPYDA